MLYYTVREVAEILKVTEESVRRFIRDKKLKASKAGQGFRVDQKALDVFMNKVKEPENVPHHKHPHHITPNKSFNSMLGETLFEMKEDFTSMDEVINIIKELDKDILPLFLKVCKDIKDPKKAVELFIEKEAEIGQAYKQDMIKSILADESIVFLPLPPHIMHNIESVISSEMTYLTEPEPQHHLHNIKYTHLHPKVLPELLKKITDKSVIVVDGQKAGNVLIVRDVIASVLEFMKDKGLKTIYFHKIPHIPKKQHFTPFDTSKLKIEIITI